MAKKSDNGDKLAGDILADPAMADAFQDIMDGCFKVDHHATANLQYGGSAVVYDSHWKRVNLRKSIKKEIQDMLLEGEISVIRPVDQVAVDLLVRNLVHIREIDAYLGEHGILDEGGNPRNALMFYNRFMGSAIKLCDQLCITPKTRIQLGLNAAPTAPDLAAEIQNAKKIDGNGH